MAARAAWFVLLFAAATPAGAFAQRGMGGMGGGMGGYGRRGNGGGGNRDESADQLAVPQYVNGVNLIIQHRQELALSDTQFKQIVVIKRTLDSTNTTQMRRIDSVQHLFQKSSSPLFGSPSSAHRDSVADARSVIQNAIGIVRDSVSAARDRAFALLSASQLTMALDYQDKAQQAIDDEQKSKAAAHGRRGGA